MAKTFTTLVSMEQYMNKACSKAVETSCNRLLGTLQELILSEYYDMFEPEYYQRKYEFFSSAVTKMLNSSMGEIFMDETMMNYGEYWNGELQLEFASKGYHGTTDIQTEGRFWDSFIDFCEKNAKNILKEELAKQGINVK